MSDDVSPIHMWRRTEYYDIPGIKRLIKYPDVNDLFGEVDVLHLVEQVYLSITQLAEDDTVVSYIALSDHPDISAVPQNDWLSWLKQKYNMEQATEQNTLFIHLLVWDSRYTYDFLKLILYSVFLSSVYLQHIILVIPPCVTVPEFLLQYFTRVMPDEIGNVQTILVCFRHKLIQRLKIRHAMEEDNEDLMPILDNISPKFRQLYGDYMISEMVTHKIKQREIIVAQSSVTERAVGIMGMHSCPDIELLNKHFELAPLYGLRKKHDDDNIDYYKYKDRDDADSNKSCSSDVNLSFLFPFTVSDTMTLGDKDVEYELLETHQLKEGDDPWRASDEITDQVLSAFYKVYESLAKHDADINVDMDKTEKKNDADINVDMDKTEKKNYIILDDISFVPRVDKSEDISEVSIAEDVVHIDNIIEYHGENNAFVIEMFALHEDIDERRSFDLLSAAFECFPDLDYCILTLPTDCRVFKMLEHFVRVTPRSSLNFPQELYVLHRNALQSHMITRSAQITDISHIKSFLKGLKKYERIQADFLSSVNEPDSPLSSYVFTSEYNIVGLIIISKENMKTDIEYLRCHYRIDDYIVFDCHYPEQHAFIKHFVLSPIFEKHARFFLKEVHRLSCVNCFYYPVYQGKNAQEHSMMSMLGQMIPILPTKRMEYCMDKLEENFPSDAVLFKCEPFALYHMNRRLSSLSKVEINYQIVVVGASDTALGFLERLLFGPTCTYLTFNNITLVDPNGFPGESPSHCFAETFLPQMSKFSARYMNNISLSTYVNVVTGNMTSIERSKKHIIIDHETVLPYDYLMLFCGKTYQPPKIETPKIETLNEIGAHIHDYDILDRESTNNHTCEKLPKNVFCLNSLTDASNAVKMIQNVVRKGFRGNVIVYGWGVEAHCCIANLLMLGVYGHKIVLVEPISDEQITYNNKDVEDAVSKSLRFSEVTSYKGYYFVNWRIFPNEEKVKFVTFESRTRCVNIECAAMFCFGEKHVSEETFHALSKAFVVVDKHLVINNNFRTNDRRIYAAGTFTKYPRIYYADKYSHCYFNSTEVGCFLADKMLKCWDPTAERDEIKVTESDSLPHIFTKPIVINCKLPRRMNYLNIRKPGIEVPLAVAGSCEDYGRIYVTGNCSDDKGYFRLHINKFGFIETITCYTKKKLNVGNLTSLYGKHEVLFDDLVNRFNAGYIEDFYEYFSEPWMQALYHEGLTDVMNITKQYFFKFKIPPGVSIAEGIKIDFQLANWAKLPEKNLQDMRTAFRKSSARAKIEYLVTKFLEQNLHDLPMYATYHKIKMLLELDQS